MALALLQCAGMSLGVSAGTKRRGERGELGGAARRAALTARDHQSKDALVLAATACINQVTTRTGAWLKSGRGRPLVTP